VGWIIYPFVISTETLVGGTQISGGEPLMKLLAVDWLKSDQRIDHIALQSSCCVQVSERVKFLGM
jgi:hypothetical protein